MHGNQSPQQKTASIAEKAAFLSHCDLFRQLSMTEIAALEHTVNIITCATGRILYRPGDTNSSLFLLKTGRVQLYHLSTDGRKLITATLEVGACFGEMPLVSHVPQNSFAETITDSTLCVISKNEAEQLIARNPSISGALLYIVGQRLTQLEAQLLDATFKSTPARVASLLLHLAQGHQHNGNPITVTGFSHEELAERLGVYRETVTLALRELKDAGAIELGRKHITIHNVTVLEQLAS